MHDNWHLPTSHQVLVATCNFSLNPRLNWVIHIRVNEDEIKCMTTNTSLVTEFAIYLLWTPCPKNGSLAYYFRWKSHLIRKPKCFKSHKNGEGTFEEKKYSKCHASKNFSKFYKVWKCFKKYSISLREDITSKEKNIFKVPALKKRKKNSKFLDFT